MNKQIAAIALAAALVGCTNTDRLAMSDFYPETSPDGGPAEFVFTANGSTIAYPSGMEAEPSRMQWLEVYLEANQMCPNGYEITDRQVIARGSAFGGNLHQVRYRGRCLPAE